MWPMAVVVVDPGSEAAISLLGVLIETRVSPLADGGLDESLGFSVGSWGVDFCALVFGSEPCALGLEQAGDEARPVVGHDTAQGDFMASEVFCCLAKKQACRDCFFIRHHGGVGHAGVVVDGHVEGTPIPAPRVSSWGLPVMRWPGLWLRASFLMSMCSMSPGASNS